MRKIPFRKTHLLAFIGLLTVLLGLFSMSASAQDRLGIPVVFLQTASSGSLEVEDYEGTLTLNNVAPNVIWLTDWVLRDTGRIPLATFLEDWELHGFSVLPPSGFLQSFVGNVGIGAPFLLRNPVYDEESNSLTFAVQTVTQFDASISQPLEEVALFIDGARTVETADVLVEDEAGNPIIGALIEISGNQYYQLDVTDETGSVTIPALLITGRYDITASAEGFQPEMRSFENISRSNRIDLLIVLEAE